MRVAEDKNEAKEIHERMRAAFTIQALLHQQATNPPKLPSPEEQIESAMDSKGQLPAWNSLSTYFHEVKERKTIRVRVSGGFVPIEVTTTFRVKNYLHEIERLANRRQRQKARKAARRRGGVFRRTRSRAQRRQQFLDNP